MDKELKHQKNNPCPSGDDRVSSTYTPLRSDRSLLFLSTPARLVHIPSLGKSHQSPQPQADQYAKRRTRCESSEWFWCRHLQSLFILSLFWQSREGNTPCQYFSRKPVTQGIINIFLFVHIFGSAYRIQILSTIDHESGGITTLAFSEWGSPLLYILACSHGVIPLCPACGLSRAIPRLFYSISTWVSGMYTSPSAILPPKGLLPSYCCSTPWRWAYHAKKIHTFLHSPRECGIIVFLFLASRSPSKTTALQ